MIQSNCCGTGKPFHFILLGWMKEWGRVWQPTLRFFIGTRVPLGEKTFTSLAPTLKQQQDFLQGPMTGLRGETADKKVLWITCGSADTLPKRRCYIHEQSRLLITTLTNNWVYILNNDNSSLSEFYLNFLSR